MKRVIIVHCWEGYPKYCWYPSVKKALARKGFEVRVPAFPETEAPQLDAWLTHLQKEIGQPDKELFLIGHSVGCITILRYLESLIENEKVGGAVLVAGFTDDLGFDELKNFFTTPIAFEYIKTRARGFVAIHSDNDPYVPLKHSDTLKEKLDAEVIIKEKMGHFSKSEEGKSCTELPDVVRAIEKLS